MAFTLEQFEFYLVIFARIAAFIYSAPFFSMNTVPWKIKIGLTAVLAYFVFMIFPYQPLSYSGSLGYLFLVAVNVVAGVTLGLFANISTFILAFAGQLMDMQIGFSMATEYDPATRNTVSLTSNIYNYAVLLIMLVSRLHYYIIEAIVDSFELIPLGGVVLNTGIYKLMIQYIGDFCVVGFRIALPVFAALMIVNAVLAILAKVAPQMNMFVIGIQLKVLIGLAVLAVITMQLDSISDFIFDQMLSMLRQASRYLH
ncbi:MAG: flagellar biosynthetic protein FliR [Lachnospiraceae bacterium]|nr:flagellar biosynthetic protein FliR [Lachnospiraceae bacterium]